MDQKYPILQIGNPMCKKREVILSPSSPLGKKWFINLSLIICFSTMKERSFQRAELEKPDLLTKEQHFTSRLRCLCLLCRTRYDELCTSNCCMLYPFHNGRLARKCILDILVFIKLTTYLALVLWAKKSQRWV